MTTVIDILAIKGHDVVTIPADATLQEAAVAMAARRVGSLLVMEHYAPIGVLGERDVVGEFATHGGAACDTPVGAVVVRELVAVAPQNDVRHCMELMTARRMRHLLVMSNGDLQGLISIGDVVKALREEQDFMIDQLGSYIAGVPGSGPYSIAAHQTE